MTESIRVGVYGAAGYAGSDLVELLLQHPQVELVFATSNTFTRQAVRGTDLRYSAAEDANPTDADVVFLALPHTASAPVAAKALNQNVRVIDLSADLRLESVQTYEAWYGVPHPHPELLPVPYGLPEMHRDQIANAQAVAVPGCYPTATLLGLYPLISLDAISLDNPIIIDAKSGVSGAGRTPTPTTHFVEVHGNLTPYKTGRKHRHIAEIEQEISKFITLKEGVIFTPHIIPTSRGLMASIYVTLNYNLTADRVHSLYVNVYADEALIDVLPLGSDAQLRDAVLRNNCAISITPVTERYVHITSVIDNLRKGAASQAVQCFNLMFNLPETTGLL